MARRSPRDGHPHAADDRRRRRQRGGARAPGARPLGARRARAREPARGAIRRAGRARERRAMTGIVGQSARRLVRLRVLSIALLGGLTYWFAVMAGTYRPAHSLYALTILGGAVLVAANALVLARRVAGATPSDVSGPLIEI